MFKHLITLALAFTSLLLSAQSYQINGTISGLADEDVYLMRILGQNRTIVDTACTNQAGSFTFELDQNTPVGLYSIIYGPSQMLEIIYNKENIRFVSTDPSMQSPVQFIESVENLIYYDYLYLKSYNLYKMDLLEPLVQQFPKDDEFYNTLLGEYRKLAEEISDKVSTLTTENPNTIAAHFIKVDSPLFTNPELPADIKKAYKKNHYFDNTDFSDTLLMRSSILTSKIIGYLSLYQKKEQTKEEMENSLLIAVDTILEKALANQQVYEFTIDFLIDGFQAVGFERGLEHLATQNQLEQLCENTERKAELENKMELIKKLAIGKTAPDFTTTGLNGDQITLSAIKAKKTLLIFWASWCPHCDEMLPELKKYYDPQNTAELEIIGVSLDEVKTDVQAALKEGDYNWINIAELKGWDGPVVLEYGIVATPTIFVLDENKNIIGKPANKYELKKMME
ncbi:MAG: redoxin domain-containing protein [Bacteroidales bacterium]|nr:redoxin domain-containing protein [Bacteroidales bacterium]